MVNKRPKVGLGLLLFKDGKILLAKRKSALGNGEYGGPGGKMEHLESFEDALLREVAEECGDQLKITNIQFLCLSNLRMYNPEHYVDIGFTAEWVSGEPKQMEPHKHGKWGWYEIDDLPAPLFACEPNYIEAFKTGRKHFAD
ncbi:MAG TPA: NUDIX domain-containing protein [Candidatus Saccharimonadales bacterium]|nr:NUDIX domain-containing protein [Candidatus Saccharimonadales bacterium]